MILSAFLQFDVAGFSTGIGTAVEGIKLLGRVAGDIGDNIKQAFDLGGALGDIADQTGETAGDVLILKQAFDDTGVGGDKLSQTLAIMRRNIADLSGSGTRVEMFEQMGLDMQALQDMGAEEQLSTIGEAIRGLENPSQQSAAAMEIFGRSGASMLTFFKDDNAIADAKASLGGLPDIMNRNASAFDAVSDRMGRFKMKSMGLWAGVAEGLLPVIDSITTMFDGVDVAAFGVKVGNVLGTIVKLFETAPLDQLLLAGLDAGWTTFLNTAVKGVLELGNILTTALTKPFAWISAAFQKAIEGTMELIGKIPGVGSALGLEGFKADSFASMYEDQLGARQEGNAAMDDFIKNFGFEMKDSTKDLWAEASAAFKADLATMQAAAGISKAVRGDGGAGGEGEEGALGGGRTGGPSISSDRLARIGGYVGGSSGTRTLESLAEKQLKETQEMKRFLERVAQFQPVAMWGG